MQRLMIPIFSNRLGERKSTLSVCNSLSRRGFSTLKEGISIQSLMSQKVESLVSNLGAQETFFIGTGEETLESSHLFSGSKNPCFIWTHHRLPTRLNLRKLDNVRLAYFPEHLFVDKEVFNFFEYSKKDIKFFEEKVSENKILTTFGVPTDVSELKKETFSITHQEQKVLFLSLPSGKSSQENLKMLLDLILKTINPYKNKTLNLYVIEAPRTGEKLLKYVESYLSEANILFDVVRFDIEDQDAFTNKILSLIPGEADPFVLAPYSSITQTVEFLKIFPKEKLFFYGMRHDDLPEKIFGATLCGKVPFVQETVTFEILVKFLARDNKKERRLCFIPPERLIANRVKKMLNI